MTYSDFYTIVYKEGLQLPLDAIQFNSKVCATMNLYSNGQHAARLQVTVEDLVNQTESLEQSLFRIIKASLSEIQMRMLVIELIDRGANVKAADHLRRSPLHYTVSKNFIQVTEILLFHGASPLQEDVYGSTPLSDATTSHKDNICSKLIRHIDSARVSRLFFDSDPLLRSMVLLGPVMRMTTLAILDSLVHRDERENLTKFIVNYSPLEVDEYGVKPGEEGFNENAMSCYELIISGGYPDFICHPAVKLLTERKWEVYGKVTFMMDGLLSIFKLIVFTAVVIAATGSKSPQNYSNSADVLRGICEAITVLLALFTAISSTIEAIRLSKERIRDFWNAMDFTSSLLILATVPLKFTADDFYWSILSVAYLLTALKLFKYATLSRKLGTYTHIVAVLIAREFMELIFIFLILSLAFAGSFALGFRVHYSFLECKDEQVSNFWLIYVTSLRMIVEKGPILKYFNHDGHHFGLFVTMLMTFYMICTMMILLEILIALISRVYSEIAKGPYASAEYQRAMVLFKLRFSYTATLIHQKKSTTASYFVNKQEITAQKVLKSIQGSVSSRRTTHEAVSQILEHLSSICAELHEVDAQVKEHEEQASLIMSLIQHGQLKAMEGQLTRS